MRQVLLASEERQQMQQNLKRKWKQSSVHRSLGRYAIDPRTQTEMWYHALCERERECVCEVMQVAEFDVISCVYESSCLKTDYASSISFQHQVETQAVDFCKLKEKLLHAYIFLIFPFSLSLTPFPPNHLGNNWHTITTGSLQKLNCSLLFISKIGIDKTSLLVLTQAYG